MSIFAAGADSAKVMGEAAPVVLPAGKTTATTAVFDKSPDADANAAWLDTAASDGTSTLDSVDAGAMVAAVVDDDAIVAAAVVTGMAFPAYAGDVIVLAGVGSVIGAV